MVGTPEAPGRANDASANPEHVSGRNHRPSISAFFPCYNDAATIEGMVLAAADTLRLLTDDFEVIVVNDGSEDGSAQVLQDLSERCPYLRVVTHRTNCGYGAALRSGFSAASKDLVFYTDGDAQYDPRELSVLYEHLTPDVDAVQGWKMERQDGWHRRLVGRAYHHFVAFLFDLRVRDVDCDFRLIRRRVLETFELKSDSGSITVELMSRIEHGGFTVREVPVHHFARPYGSSQFFNFRRIGHTFWQLAGLWLRLPAVVEQQPEILLPPVSANLQ
ncbi:MAG TPA: glycosyltransferase family 2 protein [Chloroflexota bacterium]|nr:glycosyltransferase family 2 protein [Chloroflexota bacterium]